MDPTTHAATTYEYVSALVDALWTAGVEHVCICPGARSTPLALTVVAHPSLRHWMHVDERSACFFALGLAKGTRRPVALVCTSGTAAAEFFPGVVEAAYGRVPLVVLTADRPPELQDVGAPQAIDQAHLYGRHAKAFSHVPLPESTPDALRRVRAIVTRAVTMALEQPAGAVHLNVPFREPLTPPPTGIFFEASSAQSLPSPTSTHLDIAVLQDLAQAVQSDGVVIVCGPQDNPDLPDAVIALVEKLGCVLIADVLSGVRCVPDVSVPVIDHYEAVLQAGRGTVARPTVVLRFGAPPVSKVLNVYLASAPTHYVIDEADWRDPDARATQLLHASPAGVCRDLMALIVDIAPLSPLAGHWHKANTVAAAAIRNQVSAFAEVFEGRVFSELSMLMQDGSTLFVGNSMPIRDLDAFFPRTTASVRLMCNRGANGIDGVMSSALGVAAASDAPVVLVIGDLSFYHDMNGLFAAKRHGLAATIVLINNDGGGIFSFLPQADQRTHFEEVFGTPTGLDFSHAAALYGCDYQRIDTWPAFAAAVSASLLSPGVQIIEVRTNRELNVGLHRACWDAVKFALSSESPSLGE